VAGTVPATPAPARSGRRKPSKWALIVFGIVLIGVAPFVGPELSRSSHLGFAVSAWNPEAPLLVVMDRRGGRAFAGYDNPRALVSGIVQRNGYAYIDIPEFVGEDREWDALVRCVQGHYAAFAVDIVDEMPQHGDFIRVMVGGPSLDFGFDESVHGIAPWGGHVLQDAVAFVFQSDEWDPAHLCEVAAHEVGHTLGLDHSRNCADLMSYESCGPKEFVDVAAPCGEWEPRMCGTGRLRQNAFADLVLRVGRHDPVAGNEWREHGADDVMARAIGAVRRILTVGTRKLPL